MPSLPLHARETTNVGCTWVPPRSTDQMCRQECRRPLTAEEALAAEESFTVYCKPVELYNILQRRAARNPLFLQRCLRYKIQAKQKQRIRMTVSLCGNENANVQMQSLFPIYVILGTYLADKTTSKSAVYRVSRSCILNSVNGSDTNDQTIANFVIPEMRKMSANGVASDLTVILATRGEAKCVSGEDFIPGENDGLNPFPSMLGGNCFWGKIPVDLLCSSLDKCVNWIMGRKVEMVSETDMHPTILKPSLLDKDSYLAFETHDADARSSFKVHVTICAQEAGAREKSPYDSYSYDNIPTSSLPNIVRLRTGNVIFNYKYYNDTLQQTEVTEDFSCPFCLVQCASFKGLRYHLCSCHDLFNFEFWVSEEYQIVNVSVSSDIWSSEVISDGFDPKLQTFFYRSKFKRPRQSKRNVQNHVHPHVLEVDSPEATQQSTGVVKYPPRPEVPKGITGKNSYREEELPAKRMSSVRHKSESYGSDDLHAEPASSSQDITGVCTAATPHASTSNDYAQPSSENTLAPTAMLQFAKTRKLSVERADPRNRQLLQKRQFFHSHRAQPMALEQVFSDRDSEDEVDDDIADFEDRRLLDDFVDVTKDEKHIMHLWNSFVRKQRVLADGHIPWACEAFSQMHGPHLTRNPALLWCWRLFMIKLWNHSLLDARTMNNCNIILEQHQSEMNGQKQN